MANEPQAVTSPSLVPPLAPRVLKPAPVAAPPPPAPKPAAPAKPPAPPADPVVQIRELEKQLAEQNAQREATIQKLRAAQQVQRAKKGEFQTAVRSINEFAATVDHPGSGTLRFKREDMFHPESFKPDLRGKLVNYKCTADGKISEVRVVRPQPVVAP